MIYFKLVNMSWGQLGLVWCNTEAPALMRVLLPEYELSTESLIRQTFSTAIPLSHPTIDEIGCNLQEYDRGRDVNFSFPNLETLCWGDFYQRVWRATARIPKGKVITYGQLAKEIGVCGAARAVGTALGKNPFPLIIPCHRVIRTDGKLGGFSGGGIAVKKRLLEREGVLFDARGMVSAVSRV